MMLHFFIFIVSALFLVACTPAPALNPPTGSPSRLVDVSYDEIRIRLTKQEGWFAHAQERHLILAESANPMLSRGVIDGMVINIWVQSRADDTPVLGDMLVGMMQDPAMRRSIATTTPRDFVWDGKNAAYYLLNSGDGNVTAVFVLEVPAETPYFVGVNASAPLDDVERLRLLLPSLLDGLTINDHRLSGDSLHTVLPERFIPPIYNPNPEAAMEASRTPTTP